MFQPFQPRHAGGALEAARPGCAPASRTARYALPRDALDPRHGCLPLPIILGEGTIADALDRLLESARERACEHGLEPPDGLEDAGLVARTIWPMVSLLLYLCSEEPEIGDGGRRPGNPVPKRTRRGLRLFPPDRPARWDVGVRLGAALRLGAARHEAAGEPGPEGERRRSRPRAHIRRAHWHTFLAGRARSEKRIKWLPPIPVNVDDISALPAAVRTVEEG